MKKLIILASLMVSTSAFGYVTGDKIEFQSVSTFVSAAFNKSLCLDGDTYNAVVTLCTKWETSDDDRKCVASAKFAVSQPMTSTRQRCAAWNGGDDDNCTKWVTVPYVQKPVREVKYYRNNDDDSAPYKTEIITIPSCG